MNDLITNPEVQQIVANSVLERLPEGSFSKILISLNAQMADALFKYFTPPSYLTFIAANPLIFLIATLVLGLVIALSLDFIADAWKVPFAIFVDLLDLLAIANPGILDFIAAAASFAIFMLLTRDCSKGITYSFATMGAAKCLLPLPFISILPINTVLMIIACVADRGI